MKYFSTTKPKTVLEEPPIIIGLSKQERFAILGIVGLNLPYDDLAYPRGSWNRRCLEKICETLGLETGTVEAILPLVRKTANWSMPVKEFNTMKKAEQEGLSQTLNLASTEDGGGGGGGGSDIADKEEGLPGEAPSDSTLDPPPNPSWESPLEASERNERVNVFLEMLPKSKEQLQNIVRLLLIVLVVCVGYDGRARRLLQLVGTSLAMEWHPRVGGGIRRDEEEMAQLLLATAEAMAISKRRSSQWRAAKIAGATVGGGALLFVTGGLAAPALAAALTTAGVTGVAVTTLASSSTAVATLFGIGGATRCGLAMTRRTAGITEFEIMKQTHPELRPWKNSDGVEVGIHQNIEKAEAATESSAAAAVSSAEDEVASSGVEGGEEDDHVLKLKQIKAKEHESLSLVLCISGWIHDQGDFERPWGAEPKEMELKERIYRYYGVHNPSQLYRVADILRDYRRHEDLLMTRLKEKYDQDPLAPLVPRMLTPPLDACLSGQAELKTLMNWLDAKLKADAEAAKNNTSNHAVEVNQEDIPSFTTKPPPTSLIARLEAWEKRRDMLDEEEEDEDKVMQVVTESGATVAAPLLEKSTNEAESEVTSSPLLTQDEEHYDSEEEKLGNKAQQIIVEKESESSASTEVDLIKQRAAKLGISPSKSIQEGDTEPSTTKEETSTSSKEPLSAEEAADQSQLNSVKAMWFWRQRFGSSEQLVLKWESEMLLKLGRCVSDLVASAATSAAKEVAQYTVFAALVAAVAVPYLMIQLFDQIDKTWTIACERADAAGVLLAQTLLEKKHGSRPVTLIGFSMGARLIYSCLLELERVHSVFLNEAAAETHEAEAQDETGKDSPVAGLIGDVVLMGTPVPVGRKAWSKARMVVSGRIMNCYSESDWTLGILYRSQRWSSTVAGIRPVKTRGVQDVNVSSIVSGHAEYPNKVKDILDLVALDDDAATQSFPAEKHT